MKFQLIFFYIFIHLLKFVALAKSEYNLEKFGKYDTRNDFAIFNPRGFNFGETMHFKITSENGFEDDKLYYEYLDSLENYTYEYKDDLYRVKYSQSAGGGDDDDDSEEIRYFNIVKKEEELKGLEGKYMILYFYCKGSCEIENTEKDEGKISMIYTIVFSVAGLIVLGIIVYCCFFRKKKKQSEETEKNLNKNNDGNNVYQGQVGQQQIPNQQYKQQPYPNQQYPNQQQQYQNQQSPNQMQQYQQQPFQNVKSYQNVQQYQNLQPQNQNQSQKNEQDYNYNAGIYSQIIENEQNYIKQYTKQVNEINQEDAPAPFDNNMINKNIMNDNFNPIDIPNTKISNLNININKNNTYTNVPQDSGEYRKPPQ